VTLRLVTSSCQGSSILEANDVKETRLLGLCVGAGSEPHDIEFSIRTKEVLQGIFSGEEDGRRRGAASRTGGFRANLEKCDARWGGFLQRKLIAFGANRCDWGTVTETLINFEYVRKPLRGVEVRQTRS